MTSWNVGDSRTLVHTFTREEVERFSGLTGDDNPVHLDESYARRTSAGGVVVHGMLAASFLSTLIGTRIPGPGALWLSFSVQWRKPLRIGDTLELTAEVRAVHPATGVLDLRIRGVDTTRGETCLTAEASVMQVSGAEDEEEAVPAPSDAPQHGLLAGRRILVTGATGEVGAAIARRLARDGADLVLWGRSRERLAALRDELGAAVAEVDLAVMREVRQAVDGAARRGPFHGIVHAAAPPAIAVGVEDARCLDLLGEHWQVGPAVLQALVAGLVPVMSPGAAVVGLLTQYVLGAPPPKQAAYIAGKMAMLGLIRAMAIELGPKGIRCNAVSPGMMNTPFSRDVPVRMKQVEAATNPLRRLCLPEDVAHAVAFLVGPDSAYLNGHNLPLTGGAVLA